ncbi:MAG: hypothetical protein JJE35_12595, partial [Thermoleophilia bacterium]|nr:hypothetical protein [Thermoleophilia bacterium]
VSRPRASPPPRLRPRSAERLHHEDALGTALERVASEVAAVGQRQRAGEIELRESE